ncbi:MAG: nucleoside triphosphate pyrophosphohydrolase [Oscillospiraceae bacterium]|nr:nucleoside triphosphate pyrophosphohydrolase [Oscillospiraceae bacterium]
MVDFEKKERYDFADLVRLVAFLRGENGCDWDRVQTHESIRRNFLEEAYEACEGIDLDDPDVMMEEFGDVLLQVVFHSGIEADRGRFTIDDVCTRVCRKMIRRHPHLFGGERADWETLKKQEKGAKTQTELMQGVAKSLPALIRAEKIAEKAQDASLVGESFASEQELGDRLLQIVAAAAAKEQDAETALHRAIDRYIDRYAENERAQCDAPQTR